MKAIRSVILFAVIFSLGTPLFAEEATAGDYFYGDVS